MRKLLRKIFPKQKASANTEDTRYYKLHETCQIPGLDVYYEHYLHRRTNGIFIEFGAYDGEFFSNTSALADMGWIGYYFEPASDLFKKCQKRHKKNKNTTVRQCAIGPEEGTAEIHLGGPFSTMNATMKDTFYANKSVKDRFDEQGNRSETVPVHRLDNLLKEYKIFPGFELLVVDTEGHEWPALQNFDLKYWCPQMIIIEIHDHHPDYASMREDHYKLNQYFEDADYKIIYKDLGNVIYVKKDNLFSTPQS